MAACSFTTKDQGKGSADGVVFQNADRSRTLSVSFRSGEIDYETKAVHYSATNLAIGVPEITRLPALGSNLLGKLHMSVSDITDYFGTNRIDYVEPAMTMFYVGDRTITNIPYRTVLFRRMVDGIPVVHQNCRFDFGEHGRITKVSVIWPNLKRAKSYRTVTPKDVIGFLRDGKAVRGPVPTDIGNIDWSTVKSVTIKKAVPSYQTGNNQLYPFLHLDVLIDTGNAKVDIAMACPIINETQLGRK